MQKLLKGVIPVMVTPLTKDGDIDTDAMRRLVEFLVTKEIAGLWVLGTSSEDMNLGFAKRLEVARIVAEANAGRVPLILGAGFFAMDDILNFIEETKNLAVDAFHVMPYHPLLGLDRMEWFYSRIADYCSKPLWMYTSANWCRPIPPAFVARLKNHPNIGGIKFSTKNIHDVAKVVMMQDENFQVVTAVASTFFACLCLGVQAQTTSMASCLPEFFVNMYRLFQAGKQQEALQEQYRLIEFLDEIPPGPHEDNFLASAEEKYILSLRGICGEHMTSYYRELTDEEKKAIKKSIIRHRMLSLEDLVGQQV